MKAFNCSNVLFICFDTTPLDDPIRIIGNILSGNPYSHVRLIDQVFIEGEGYFTTVSELTHDGIFVESFNVPAYQLTFESHCNLKVIPKMIPFDVRCGMYEKLEVLEKLKLRWSNWYMLPYMLGKGIPSLTCCSLVSYLLYGGKLIHFPKDLIKELSHHG